MLVQVLGIQFSSNCNKLFIVVISQKHNVNVTYIIHVCIWHKLESHSTFKIIVLMFDCMFKHTQKSLNTNNLFTTHHPCTSKRLNLKKTQEHSREINVMTQGMAHLQQVRLGIKFGESDCKSKHPSRQHQPPVLSDLPNPHLPQV